MTSHSQYSPVDAPGAARTSQSPSDDGSNYYQGDAVKEEGTSCNVETNQTLTSQTLNADGTPKRPMNAFMIFARRRRPQVSSENQSMRTGEISKILSKEWNTMPAHDKQFYLDRAKELKETFNSKYPDYVYRRRPNHSRKRRKTDAGVHSVDGSGTPDTIQDEGLPRAPYDDRHGGSLHPRPSLPSYGSSDPYGRESSRHPYLNADRPNHHHHSMSPPINHNAPLPSPRLPGQSNSIPALHSYLSSQNIPSAGQSHHMYGSSSSHHSSHGGSSWDHPRLDTPGKLGNDSRLDSSHGRSSSAGSNSMWPGPERSSSRGYAGQSGSPTSSGPSSSTGGGGHDNNFNFPTLNSPFFPTPSQMFNSNSGSSASSAGGGNSSTGGGGSGGSAFGAASNQLPPPGGLSNTRNGYDHRSYAPSPPPPLSGTSFAQSASRHGLGTSNGIASGGLGGIGSLGSLSGLGSGGNSGLPRSLPPVQSIPGYSQSGLGNGGSGGDIGDIWSRGTVNGP
ncbi:hypothetical protein J3R30DRAFT_3714092 [Lentinula aciculospora]|uniref:HMG box domain-containing protein n=1 Tax=Lentinula aciculospora TaxID=153920 RepID=A0A9W8ZYV9_9AGAR|nr:hypothetical protein J3R30DRAFT_3714092 [Lentinula aciculospora]